MFVMRSLRSNIKIHVYLQFIQQWLSHIW